MLSLDPIYSELRGNFTAFGVNVGPKDGCRTINNVYPLGMGSCRVGPGLRHPEVALGFYESSSRDPIRRPRVLPRALPECHPGCMSSGR